MDPLSSNLIQVCSGKPGRRHTVAAELATGTRQIGGKVANGK
jgi:hypothetical protein